MKKVIALIVLLIGSGVFYYRSIDRSVAPPAVAEAVVSRGTVTETVTSTGTLQAFRTVDVGSQVSGIVQELYVDFNSIVKKGQILARLDPSLLQVQVDLQTANVERQTGEIASQEMQLENDRKNLERIQQLFDRQLANRQQLDEAQLRVTTRLTQVDAARKQLLTNQANLDQAELNLSYTVIRSPIDGVVVNRLIDVGQAVQSSMSVAQFFTLATDLRVLRLQADVDESDIGKIRPGMPVAFTVDAYGAEQFRGEVMNVRLNAQSQNNVVTYPVWISVANEELKLRPSMTANLRVIVSTATDVVRVPNQAIRFRPTAETYAALGLEPPATPTRAATTTTPRIDRPESRVSLVSAPGLSVEELEYELNGLPALEDGRIDEYFAPVTRASQRGTVWTWDEAGRTLEAHEVTLGVSDGSFTEVIAGDLELGQEIITAITLPQTAAQRQQTSVFATQPQTAGSRGIGPGGGGGRGF